MIVDILQHTPAWVFVLFVALVAVGFRLMRPVAMSRARVTVLPVVMAALALSSLAQGFGLASAAAAAWVAVVSVFVAVGTAVAPRSDVQYSTGTKRFAVPGSAVPLLLMMTIFFTRYGVAVLLAIHPDLRAATGFGAVVGATYGLTSGAFALRALRIVRAMRSATPPSHRPVAERAVA